MTAQCVATAFLSVEDYLAAEPLRERKREYIGGYVYEVPASSEAHCRIQMNLYGELSNQLRGRKCEAFGSDMRVHFQMQGERYYYYPDAMIACDPSDSGRPWREQPTVLFEIITEDRRSIDEREKRIAYKQLPSLQAYVRIEQDRAELICEHRAEPAWRQERITGLDGILRLPLVEVELPLAALYERVPLQ